MATTFAYKVRDQSGKLVEGQLEADDATLVVGKLRQMGYTPIAVEAKHDNKLKADIKIPGLSGRVKLKDVAVFSRQFATMINSGLSLIRSLAILADQTENEELARVIGEVRLDVEKGVSLSSAISKHPKVFSRLYIAMVRSGEIGGVLDAVLMRLADTIEKQVELRRKIRSAMTYPIVALAICLLIATAMLLFIVPQFESIYTNLGGELPLPTKILLMASRAVRTYWYIVILGGVGLSFAFRRYKKTESGRARVDAVKIRVPVFGPLFHKVAIARFSSTFGMLLHAGVPILQALDIVKDTVNNKVISRAVEDVKGSIREGESIAKPLSKHAVFPPMVVQMMAVGEETGAVDTMLEKVAQFYNSEVSASVDALTSLIEPLLIAVIGGAVGAAVVALYMPMFNIINLLQ